MIIGNPNEDFKEQNPKLCTFGDFVEIYKKEKNASQILWCYYFVTFLHDDKNPYRNLSSLENRIAAVKEEYYPKFDYNKYINIVDAFKMVALTKEEVLFNAQYKKLEEITSYFDNLDVSEGEKLDDYIKLLKILPNIWKQFKIFKEEYLESSKTKTSVHGDSELSASDKRHL